MPWTDRRLAAALNPLLAACCDAASGWRAAADRVADPRLRRLMRDFGRERRDFHCEIRAQVLRLGGEPAGGGTIRGALHRGWMRATGAPDVLSQCIVGETEALRRYADVLRREPPPDVREILQRHHGRIEEVLGLVRDLAQRGG